MPEAKSIPKVSKPKPGTRVPGYARDRYTRVPVTFLDQYPLLNVKGFTVRKGQNFPTPSEKLVLGDDPLQYLANEPDLPRVYVKGGRYGEPRGDQIRQHEMVHAVQGLYEKGPLGVDEFNKKTADARPQYPFWSAVDEWKRSFPQYDREEAFGEMPAFLLSGNWSPSERLGTSSDVALSYLDAIKRAYGNEAANTMARYGVPEIRAAHKKSQLPMLEQLVEWFRGLGK